MFSISGKLDIDLDEGALLDRLGLDKGGPLQRMIDQRVMDYCRPYMPASPGRTLEKSAELATDVGSGTVIWDTPYARLLYYNAVYGPNIPIYDPDTGLLMGFFSQPGKKKHPTGKKFEFDQSQNHLAGAFWFERMKADRLGDLLDEGRRLLAKEMR